MAKIEINNFIIDFSIKVKKKCNKSKTNRHKHISDNIKQKYLIFLNDFYIIHKDEIFVPIYFNNNYSVSNYGKVKNSSDMILKPNLDNRGYLKVSIKVKNKRKDIFIHKLVAEHFIGINNELVIDHIDGNQFNNYYKNLRYCTIKENTNNINTKNRIREGILNSEYGHKRKVLLLREDNSVVREYRSASQAAKNFGVSKTYMCQYLNHKVLTNGKGTKYTIKHIKGRKFIWEDEYNGKL